MDKTIGEYVNQKFRDHLLDGKTYISSEYGYTIEKVNTGRAIIWELVTQTTGISEMDGVEEGILETYIYFDEESPVKDIENANQFSGIEFQEI